MILRSVLFTSFILFSFRISYLLAQNNTNAAEKINSANGSSVTSTILSNNYPAEGGSVNIPVKSNANKFTTEAPKSKIVARKGAGSPFIEQTANLTQTSTVQSNKNNTANVKENTVQNITSTSTTMKPITTTTSPKPTKPHITYSVEEETDNNLFVKPNVVNNNNQNNSNDQKTYSENKESMSGLNIGIQIKSHGHPDYIVPVVVTIFAVPIFVGFTVYLVRKARDYWDKRHYRRMDFLIDGMYND